MNGRDESSWRRLVGQDDVPEETPEEVQAREERIAGDNPKVMDLFSKEWAERTEQARRSMLDHYSLNDAYTEDEKQIVDASIDLMSEEQKKQYLSARRAYRKRGFRIVDPDDPTIGLVSFAATNPPEVLRRHVWSLQRGLAQPMFGEEPGEKPNRVREYTATVSVSLCNRCAEELERETDEAGAERVIGRRDRYGNFYERGGASAGYYLFRYEELYVEMERGDIGGFPLQKPKACDRCGTDDVSLWRERYGERD